MASGELPVWGDGATEPRYTTARRLSPSRSTRPSATSSSSSSPPRCTATLVNATVPGGKCATPGNWSSNAPTRPPPYARPTPTMRVRATATDRDCRRWRPSSTRCWRRRACRRGPYRQHIASTRSRWATCSVSGRKTCSPCRVWAPARARSCSFGSGTGGHGSAPREPSPLAPTERAGAVAEIAALPAGATIRSLRSACPRPRRDRGAALGRCLDDGSNQKDKHPHGDPAPSRPAG